MLLFNVPRNKYGVLRERAAGRLLLLLELTLPYFSTTATFVIAHSPLLLTTDTK